MNYHIRKAEFEDLDRVLEIYLIARKFMAENGNPNQWGTEKPAQWQLEDDIRNEDLYVVEVSEKISGVFAFLLGEDPTYRRIYEGEWHYSGDYGTIHRLASDGSGGIFHACVDYCGSVIPHLRIDTHQDNTVMQGAIAKEGFEKCGVILLSDGSPRIAYDRLK